MDLKEILAELLEEARDKALEFCGSLNEGFGAWYAKYLIAHGVEIPVRCKDCKYYYCGKCSNSANGWVPSRKADDFCSYGERRDDA